MFAPMPTAVRKDPLGRHRLSMLVANLGFVRTAASAEHIISTGEHNAVEVPRVVRRIKGVDGGTDVTPASSDITAVTYDAVGEYTLTLAASRFDTTMRVEVNPRPAVVKPYLVNVKVVSATSVKVYIFGLTTALNAVGNAWAAIACDFDIAIHSTPLSAGTWTTLPLVEAYGSTLGADSWNVHVYDQAEAYGVLITEHTANGTHNVHQVAKEWGYCVWNSGNANWDLVAGTQGATTGFATKYTGLTGVATFTTANTYGATTDCHIFTTAEYPRASGGTPSDTFISQAGPLTTSSAIVELYHQGGDTKWNLVDADFFFAIYGT